MPTKTQRAGRVAHVTRGWERRRLRVPLHQRPLIGLVEIARELSQTSENPVVDGDKCEGFMRRLLEAFGHGEFTRDGESMVVWIDGSDRDDSFTYQTLENARRVSESDSGGQEAVRRTILDKLYLPREFAFDWLNRNQNRFPLRPAWTPGQSTLIAAMREPIEAGKAQSPEEAAPLPVPVASRRTGGEPAKEAYRRWADVQRCETGRHPTRRQADEWAMERGFGTTPVRQAHADMGARSPGRPSKTQRK